MPKVSSKDPRVQAALDARRQRVAAKKASNKTMDAKKKKKKGPSLGSGLAENARRLLSGRSSQINKAVKKATRGK